MDLFRFVRIWWDFVKFAPHAPWPAPFVFVLFRVILRGAAPRYAPYIYIYAVSLLLGLRRGLRRIYIYIYIYIRFGNLICSFRTLLCKTHDMIVYARGHIFENLIQIG